MTMISQYGAWQKGTLNAFDNGGTGSFSDAFNQAAGIIEVTATNLPGTLSTVTLLAKALGVVNVSWDSSGGPDTLGFFGLTSAPGTSFTIVPEPSTGLLVIAGLLGLGLRNRVR
jgi:hypothetical protein